MVRPPVYLHVKEIESGYSFKVDLRPWSSLQMIVGLADSLTETSWEILSQKQPAKSFQDFWLPETLWVNKCLLLSAAKFWG